MCPEWKAQQKILWAVVRKETGTWEDRWKIRDLLADERCIRAMLDFLTSTDVGRRVPAEEVEAVSEVSEAEMREWQEEQEAGAEEPGAGGNHHYSCPRLPSWRPRRRSGGGGGHGFLCSPFFCPFICDFLGTFLLSWDRLGRRAKGSLQRAATARTVDRKRRAHNLAMI